MHTPTKIALATLVACALPVAANAAACVSGSSLASVIAAGTCTLGDLTLDFTEPHLLGQTYLNGPFAGDSGAAPSASQIIFTTDTTDPDNVSFTLGLALKANGGYSYIPSSGITKPGSYYDMDLSYLKVFSTATRGLAGYSVALINPVSNLPSSDTYSAASASLNGAVSYIAADGTSQAVGSDVVDPAIFGGLKYFDLSARAYNYSSDYATSIGFDGIKVGFKVVSSVPEPATLALSLLGLGVVAGIARRRAS